MTPIGPVKLFYNKVEIGEVKALVVRVADAHDDSEWSCYCERMNSDSPSTVAQSRPGDGTRVY